MVEATEEVRDNVTMITDAGWAVPCWLCGTPTPVKFSKKRKPYLICDSCGVQTFVRYGRAEDLLIAKIKQYQKGE